MKKFTPEEKMRLRREGYSNQEIIRMEMEAEEDYEDDEEEMMEEGAPGQEGGIQTNAKNMRGIDWKRMKDAGAPEFKRANIMKKK